MITANFFYKLRHGLFISRPLYMLRLLRLYLLAKFTSKKPLRTLEFAVDYKCNLKCKHCFNDSLSRSGRKMTLDDYAKVIDEASRMGVVNFSFQGGELLILKDFDLILKLIDKRRHTISIITNGSMLDREMVLRLKDLGVTSIAVSLDSGFAAEHDQFRGNKGLFDKAMRGIELAREQGIQVTINTTITPVSLKSGGFESLLHFTRKQGIQLNTIFATPTGRWSGNKDILLSKEDVAAYYEMTKGFPNVIRDIDSGMTSGCPAGVEILYITPYGDALPCPFIQIRAGNIFENSLRNIHELAEKYYHGQRTCMISENKQFIEEYASLTQSASLPLPESYLGRIDSWDSGEGGRSG